MEVMRTVKLSWERVWAEREQQVQRPRGRTTNLFFAPGAAGDEIRGQARHQIVKGLRGQQQDRGFYPESDGKPWAGFKGREIVLAAVWRTSYRRARVEVERPAL